MYLLQDATESLVAHRKRGFDRDPHQAYIEFWGATQAVIIQQDSIAELYRVIVGSCLDWGLLPNWASIRELRNTCAGHPARRDRPRAEPLTRSFMGRGFGGYDAIKYEQWQEGRGTPFPVVNFGALLDAYAIEAESKMNEVIDVMRGRWPP